MAMEMEHPALHRTQGRLAAAAVLTAAVGLAYDGLSIPRLIPEGDGNDGGGGGGREQKRHR